MDPRIAWHPSELVSNAYSTWTNIWMIAQLNSTTNSTASNENNNSGTGLVSCANSATNLLSNGVNNNQSTSNLANNENTKPSINSSNSTSTSSMASTQKVRTISGCNDDSSTNLFNYNSNSLNSVVTPQAILNGLKSRKTNKASTYGFNFPVNQDILDDPMSTPWNYLKSNIKLPSLINENLLSSSSNNNNSLTSSIASSPSNHNDDDSNSTASSYSSTTNLTDEQDNISVNNDLNSNDTTSNIIKNNGYYSEGLINLHKEIMHFSEYIAPTVEEIYMRNEIIWRITKIIKDQLPQADVDVFGSYKTGLFLPTSDIDMVVLGEWKTLPLNLLKEALIREKLCDPENIKVLDKATVPIIKIVEANTDLKVDISFNTMNGIKSAELIRKYLIEYPCLRPLVMVLKQFLIQRDFNEVWTGGIGSYSLILMTVSFLQMHSRIDPRSHSNNLGQLLIEFFELYGRCFNYMKTAIRIQNGGCYVPKEEILKQFQSNSGYRSSILCIEDPLNPSNDIGKGSYGALKVKQAFEYAYFQLMHAVLPQNEFILKSNINEKLEMKTNKSILGRIIRITKEVRDYRDWVKVSYEKKVHVVLDLAKGLIIQQHQQQHQHHLHHHLNPQFLYNQKNGPVNITNLHHTHNLHNNPHFHFHNHHHHHHHHQNNHQRNHTIPYPPNISMPPPSILMSHDLFLNKNHYQQQFNQHVLSQINQNILEINNMKQDNEKLNDNNNNLIDIVVAASENDILKLKANINSKTNDQTKNNKILSNNQENMENRQFQIYNNNNGQQYNNRRKSSSLRSFEHSNDSNSNSSRKLSNRNNNDSTNRLNQNYNNNNNNKMNNNNKFSSNFKYNKSNNKKNHNNNYHLNQNENVFKNNSYQQQQQQQQQQHQQITFYLEADQNNTQSQQQNDEPPEAKRLIISPNTSTSQDEQQTNNILKAFQSTKESTGKLNGSDLFGKLLSETSSLAQILIKNKQEEANSTNNLLNYLKQDFNNCNKCKLSECKCQNNCNSDEKNKPNSDVSINQSNVLSQFLSVINNNQVNNRPLNIVNT